ncbi:hypothetical protein AKJ09_01826 [Labilithrix luteola]|uniref:Uncharacterized protein n=1 Tax=Labilithrix luteola TaxID=1391654 RepID=A0A0K1PNR9_9BACT|nr:hypothetical protein AKJ09_01826 [Labilithrix luteola]
MSTARGYVPSCRGNFAQRGQLVKTGPRTLGLPATTVP